MLEWILNGGFVILMGVLMWEDYQKCLVDDRKILVGIVFVFILQYLLGHIQFAIEGGIIGGCFAGFLWFLGRFFEKDNFET